MNLKRRQQMELMLNWKNMKKEILSVASRDGCFHLKYENIHRDWPRIVSNYSKYFYDIKDIK
jgi:hypothetical protein